MVGLLPSLRKWSPASLSRLQNQNTYENTHFESKMSLASWVPPGCFLGGSWVPPGCLLVAYCTGRHVLLFHEKTCLRGEREDMLSCSTRRHIFLFNTRHDSCCARRHVFLLNKKTCRLVEQEDMSPYSTKDFLRAGLCIYTYKIHT